MRIAKLIVPALLTACGVLAMGQSNVPPKVSVKVLNAKAKPGEKVKATLTVGFGSGLHAYQNPPSESYMIPVTVTSKGVSLVKAAYPKGVDAAVGGDTKPVKVYEGTVQIPILLLAPAKPGTYSAALTVRYQQCNATSCFPPGTVAANANFSVVTAVPKAPAKAVPPVKPGGTHRKQGGKGKRPQPPTREIENPREVKHPLKPGGFLLAVDDGTSLARFQLVGEGRATSAAASPQPSDGFIASHLSEAFRTGNYSLVILLALLTGLALAVTPCVYPMIPVTVSFFSGQAAGSRRGRVGLGLMYMLGLAATYGAVGGISAALGGTIGSLFQAPWFLFALGLLMTVLALSMFDVYEIRIPQFLGRHIHGRSGPVGALIMGLLMGFAAAPCAGAVVTAFAVKVAEFRSVGLGLLVFTSIGIGIGLPFFALGAFATGAKALPKAGGWLKTLKALLGVVVLWVGLNYFLQAFQLRSGEPKTLLIQAIFLIASGVYLFVFEKSGSTQAVWGMKGLAILLCGLWAGQFLQARDTVIRDQQLAALGAATDIQWKPFTVEAFEAAKKSGKPIVIDASADWCAVCHEIDNLVFKQPAGIAAMKNVVALRIDQSTGVDPKYVEMTTKLFDIKGLPHVQIFRPGGESYKVITGIDGLKTPAQLQQYLQEAGAQL